MQSVEGKTAMVTESSDEPNDFMPPMRVLSP